MQRRHLLGLGLALLVSFGGFSCNLQGSATTIKIVSSLPLTGSSLPQSQTMVNAIQMALDESNHKAGKFQIDYESMDDATAQAQTWDPGKEQENAQRAVSDPNVMVYIGTFNSGAAKIAIPITNRAGLVMVSPANTYTGLTVGGPYVDKGEPDIYYPSGVRTFCRLVPNDSIQGTAQAWWAQKLGARKVYVLDDRDLYGEGLAAVFSDQCRKRGLAVVGPEGIDKGAPDFRALMNKVKDASPDLVYFGGITQHGAGKLVKDMREAGIKAMFMGPDGIREQAFLESAGNASEGAYVTLGAMPVEKLPARAKEWYDRYRSRYNSEPESYAIYAYEAARVVLSGIERAGVKDRKAIRDAIFNTKDFDGVLGKWSFDQNGDTTINSMSGYQVRNHRFQFVQVLQPD